jgi:hypothetical protein
MGLNKIKLLNRVVDCAYLQNDNNIELESTRYEISIS